MKKLIIILCFLTPLLGIAALVSAQDKRGLQRTNEALEAHWFRLADGTYLGYFDIDDLELICGRIAVVDCTIGFEEYDFENDTPLSDPIILEGEYEL